MLSTPVRVLDAVMRGWIRRRVRPPVLRGGPAALCCRATWSEEIRGNDMFLTRRGFATTSAAAIASAGVGRAALAQAEPIRIGWLATLTGPLSSPGIGFDR